MLNNKVRYGLCVMGYVLGIVIFAYSVNCFAQDEFVYDAKGKRNPFIPLVTSTGKILKLDNEESKTGLLLEGIIYDERGISYAIVNGEIVKVGDIINDHQVLKVEKNKVVFIKDGQPLELELKKEE